MTFGLSISANKIGGEDQILLTLHDYLLGGRCSADVWLTFEDAEFIITKLSAILSAHGRYVQATLPETAAKPAGVIQSPTSNSDNPPA